MPASPPSDSKALAHQRRERYSDAAVGNVVRNRLVGNELTHRMNNGQLKAGDEHRHNWTTPGGELTATRWHKSPLSTGCAARFARFGNPKGNRTVAQSYQRHTAMNKGRRFIRVSPSCRSWGTGPSVRPAATAAGRKIFGRKAPRRQYRRPRTRQRHGLAMRSTETPTPKMGVRRAGRPIPITNESPFRAFATGPARGVEA
jgi:hypothetical protein